MSQHDDNINDLRQINLSSVIYGNYTRLEVLEKLVYNTYGNSSIATATKLNVFIDITSVIHALYSEHNRVVYNNITDVSAGILNMCAHYRGFFRHNLGVDTKFFLINSLNTCSLNTKFIATYNQSFANKSKMTQTKSLIDNNMTLLKVLCPYIPGVYYIDSVDNYETSVIMAYLIEMLNEKVPNLIISHDIYPMQLTALYPYTSYLYPNKTRNKIGTDDTSWMLPINEKPGYRELFWSYFCSTSRGSSRTEDGRRMYASTIKPDKLINLSPLNMPLVLAMNGYPGRYISRLYSIPKVKQFIEALVGSEDIKIDSSMYMNNEQLSNTFAVAQIDAIYKTLDVTYALPFYRNSPDAKNIKLVDLEDAPTVNMICSKYYANNPINIFNL